jgi:two-component sensor histidine kinase
MEALRSDGSRFPVELAIASSSAGRRNLFTAYLRDITDRKAADARQALLSREVDHRAKNALSVALAAVRLTRAPDMPTYVRTVEGRVVALARAQTLLAEDRWFGADLQTLLRGELTPFLSAGEGGGPRADLEGPKVMLPAGATQPLAMALHELATNAVKHGALSVPNGRLAVAWYLDGGPSRTLRLRWSEAGGPTVSGPPPRKGFGSRVLQGTVRDQLQGRVTLAWEASGLVCDIEAPLGPLSSGPGTPAVRPRRLRLLANPDVAGDD